MRLPAAIRMLALPLLLALTLAACSSGDDDGDASVDAGETPAATRADSSGDADLSEHEDELRETAPAAVKAIFASGGVEAYSYASADFKDKCPLDDFLGIIALAKVFLGEIDADDMDVTVTDIRYDADRAYVTLKATIEGEDFSGDEGDDGEFGDYWVYEDGDWKWGTDDDEPCSADFDSGSDDDATPASGPGSSRGEPAPRGDSAETEDLRVTVIDADLNAAGRLDEISDFPETPEAGQRVVLLTVRAEHAGANGDETIDVSESNFKLTGSGNVLYDTFEHGCGFIEGDIDAEMFPGGTAEGLVCFTVPANETDLLLVVEPTFSFDAGTRRYLALE